MSEVAGKKECEYDVEWTGLNFEDREKLYEHINLRVDNMIEQGGIQIDGTKITDWRTVVQPTNELVVQRGKKTYLKIIGK